MGGSSDTRTVIRDTISQELNIMVSNSSTTLSKIINETISDISTKIAQDQVTQIKQQIGFSNLFNVAGDAVFDGPGTNFTLDQQGQILAESSAIANMIQSASALQDMASKAAAQMLQEQAARNEIQQSATQLAKISETATKGGGPEGMLDSLTTMVSGMLGDLTGIGSAKSVSTEKITEIKSAINTELKSTVLSENYLANLLKTTIEQSFAQSSNAECQQIIRAENAINFGRNLTVKNGASVNLGQAVKITDLRKCIMSLDTGSKIATEIGVASEFLSQNSQSTGNTTSQSASQDAEISRSSSTTSAIMNALESLFENISSLWRTSPAFMWMVIGVAATGCIGALALAFGGVGGGGKKSKRGRDDMDMDMDMDMNEEHDMDRQIGGFNSLLDSLNSEISSFGGADNINTNYGNIYLWALIAVLVYYVFGSSLPMSSALVIAIICYIIYIGDKK